jgi:Flp pilus assembly protein TadD
MCYPVSASPTNNFPTRARTTANRMRLLLTRMSGRSVRNVVVLVLCLVSLGGWCERLVLSQATGGRTIEKTTATPRSLPRKATRRRVTRQILPGTNMISLLVISNPASSKVFVNNELRGETDPNGELETKLSPGNYSIRVSREGYVTREAEVDVLATPDAQEVEFTLPSPVTSLNIVTDPPGAEVYLDDVYKGSSGADGLLVLERVNPSQPHTLRLSKDNYVPQSTPITSYTGQISIKLLPDSIRLKITTDPPEAEVYLDEVYKGTSTAEGTLVVEQVNPNQSHTVRAKKDGFRQQSTSLAAGSAQSTVTLSPDPIVLLVRLTKELVAGNRLVEAGASFNQLAKAEPNHQELPRLSESILLALQARTTEMLKRVEPYGLSVNLNETREMSSLYTEVRTWRRGDEAIDNLGKYWSLRLALLSADGSASAPEATNLRRSARSSLSDLSEQNLRNPYLLLELGWSWWKLGEKAAARRQFAAAQELKPDWAYPHFALGVMSMDAGENERAKSAKVAHFNQALESLSKAIALKHDFATAYALKSMIYSQLKKEEEAIANGLQAVAVDPQSAYAHFVLGYAYFEKGKSQYRNSLNEFNRALALGGAELSDLMKNTMQTRVMQIKKIIKY